MNKKLVLVLGAFVGFAAALAGMFLVPHDAETSRAVHHVGSIAAPLAAFVAVMAAWRRRSDP